MKKILLIAAIFSLSACCFFPKLDKKIDHLFHKKSPDSLAASNEFVQGSEDIPLIVGMNKISDGALGFDSAAGSIISSNYSSNLPPKEVREFYIKTLPQMGWKLSHQAENAVKFKRDKEALEIEFAQENHLQVVRFFYSSLTE